MAENGKLADRQVHMHIVFDLDTHVAEVQADSPSLDVSLNALATASRVIEDRRRMIVAMQMQTQMIEQKKAQELARSIGLQS